MTPFFMSEKAIHWLVKWGQYKMCGCGNNSALDSLLFDGDLDWLWCEFSEMAGQSDFIGLKIGMWFCFVERFPRVGL